jgi:hypothetical protein
MIAQRFQIPYETALNYIVFRRVRQKRTKRVCAPAVRLIQNPSESALPMDGHKLLSTIAVKSISFLWSPPPSCPGPASLHQIVSKGPMSWQSNDGLHFYPVVKKMVCNILWSQNLLSSIHHRRRALHYGCMEHQNS